MKDGSRFLDTTIDVKITSRLIAFHGADVGGCHDLRAQATLGLKRVIATRPHLLYYFKSFFELTYQIIASQEGQPLSSSHIGGRLSTRTPSCFSLRKLASSANRAPSDWVRPQAPCFSPLGRWTPRTLTSGPRLCQATVLQLITWSTVVTAKSRV
jgi:hypothetical protein